MSDGTTQPNNANAVEPRTKAVSETYHIDDLADLDTIKAHVIEKLKKAEDSGSTVKSATITFKMALK